MIRLMSKSHSYFNFQQSQGTTIVKGSQHGSKECSLPVRHTLLAQKVGGPNMITVGKAPTARAEIGAEDTDPKIVSTFPCNIDFFTG